MAQPAAQEKIKIAICSQPEYFSFAYENDLRDFADIFEFRMTFRLSPSDLTDLIAYQADFNFFFRGEFLPVGVLEQLTGVNVAFSSEPFPRSIDGRYEYTLDSIRRYLTFRSIRAQPFDYVFHYDKSSLSFLAWDRLYLSGEFAFPVATSVYSPVEMDYRWDLFFIGRSTLHRESFFIHLKHAYNFLHICHGIWGDVLRDYFCSAKICLNVHAEDEISWEPRMQMMLACGAFVISEKLSPNGYLRPGVDYVEVRSPEEMASAVKYYISHDDERLTIAKSGHERVKKLLDSRTNFKQLISDINGDKYKKFSANKGRAVLDAVQLFGHLYNQGRRWFKFM